MKLSDILRAHVEKLKRIDEELNREILESVERCNVLLDELKQLDKQ
jgi:flagellar hook-associated protein FlgK